MGKNNERFVARAIAGVGWQIFNRKIQRNWGNPFKDYPQDLLNELNGKKRPEKLVELSRKK